MKMQALTQRAAEFAAHLRFEDIPTSAHAVVGTGFADCVAVMLAAGREPIVRILGDELACEAQGRSALLMGGRRARATDAALLNGAAAHAFDFDDIGLGAHPAHPSAVLVPAILALADELGSSGREMLTAYVAGYEIWGEVALRDADQHHTRGWHPTGVFGPLAAATASARLMKLNVEQTRHALGIAASRSAGLLSNYGSMTKPMHAGLSAQSGVFAARLAARGFTAGAAAIEHEQGLLRALSPHGRIDLDGEIQLGSRWYIADLPLGFKQYPVCYAMHRAVDAAIDLRKDLPGAATESVRQITVTLGVDQAKLLHIHSPTDRTQAKFSLEFGVAAALIAGRLSLHELSDEFVRSKAVRSLMGRLRIELDEARDPVYRIFSPFDIVELELASGERLRRECRTARGHPDLPLASDAHWAKFASCTEQAFAADDARLSFEALMNLPALSSTAALPCTTL